MKVHSVSPSAGPRHNAVSQTITTLYQWADEASFGAWFGVYSGSGRFNKYWRTKGAAPQGTWLSVVHQDERDVLVVQWRQAAELHRPFQHSARLSYGTGAYRWFDIHGLPLDKAGENYWQVYAVDIDRHMQLKHNLLAQAQLRDRMLDVSVDCIKLLHPDGNLAHMNRSGCVALGLGENPEKFGMPWLSFLPQRCAGAAGAP